MTEKSLRPWRHMSWIAWNDILAMPPAALRRNDTDEELFPMYACNISDLVEKAVMNNKAVQMKGLL